MAAIRGHGVLRLSAKKIVGRGRQLPGISRRIAAIVYRPVIEETLAYLRAQARAAARSQLQTRW